MNTPITAHSKALADEGRAAADELVKAKHEIIAELARVTAENTQLHNELYQLVRLAQKYYDSGTSHGLMCRLSPCVCGRTELGHALVTYQKK